MLRRSSAIFTLLIGCLKECLLGYMFLFDALLVSVFCSFSIQYLLPACGFNRAQYLLFNTYFINDQ